MKIKFLIFIHIPFCFYFNSIRAQINFVDRSVDLGIVFTSGTTYNGNGITFYDFDHDGFDDISVTTASGMPPHFFRNNNGQSFTSHNFLNELDFQSRQINWVDIDNDGDSDLFITSDTNGNKLFRNNGNLNFEDITAISGFPIENIYSYGSSWGDYNNDGFLDVFICSYDSSKVVPNYLFKNNGNNTFTNVSSIANISSTGHLSFCSAFFDYNNDGWQDIYISNDRILNTNILYKNNGNGTFTDVSEESNTNIAIDAMSVTIDDFNGDNWFDIYVTNSPDDGNILLKNNGNGTFTDITVSSGTKIFGFCWGAVFLDAENDGDLDLYVSSSLNGASVYNSSLFLENLDNTNFSTDSDFGFFNDTKVSHSNAIGDLNNDGLFDIIVNNSDNDLANIWMNETSTENKWIKINLEGTTSNKDGIGSIIEISVDGKKQFRYTLCGEGYLSQNSSSEIFGLGSNANIDYVKVKWLSGIEDYFYNVDVNQAVTLIEGTGNSNTPIYGCTDPNSCNYNPNATFDDGTCILFSSKHISGNINPNPFIEEIYFIEDSTVNNYHWEITNGEILNGQGTNSINVKWHATPKGSLSAFYQTESCTSISSFLEVNINLTPSETTQYSIARIWNEVLLQSIRTDYARPTIHARNLFHISVAMYDAWAIYNSNASPYFLGKEIKGFKCEFDNSVIKNSNKELDKIRETLSYSAYGLLKYRFRNSPNSVKILESYDLVMSALGYDISFESTDYSNGNPAAIGNYLASKLIEFGHQDGSNELNDYNNLFYQPRNEPLLPVVSGNTTLTDPNSWQPISLDVFIDQSGNITSNNTPEFLSPEWGNVIPFALKFSDITQYIRDSNTYNVYLDPGKPPYITSSKLEISNIYKWGFSLVSIWGSHLSPNDNVLWDISPNSIGNISLNQLPENFSSYENFYDLINGGDIGKGYAINPITNRPYDKQIVPRGDYARVLAEFWADGPDSETPPGHWFTILNYINDHPKLNKKFEGNGGILSNLEWEVKSYFILGGAMHDAAIAAWSIKGWYDYIRPISAIRYMAEKGQSSNIDLDNYHPQGIPLIDGFIEIVNENDDLAGDNGEHIGKIKLYTWKGHDFINNTETDVAGVGWILAENWWPYQRPSFVTPPFAGYVSGHSTYSRAAAEVLTRLTGTEYFPGGLGEFEAKKNEFLVFEDGPSQDIILQWATYRDASDQCSLSRIWGGIHPPMDDIAGRIIGEKIGNNAFDLAKVYFDVEGLDSQQMRLFPNPVTNLNHLIVENTFEGIPFLLFDIQGNNIPIKVEFNEPNNRSIINLPLSLSSGIYVLTSKGNQWKVVIN